MAGGNDTLRRLISEIGREPARSLCARYGGTKINLPNKLGEGHRLARELGGEAAARLVRNFGPGRLYVPFWPAGPAERPRQVRELTAAGHSAPAIARRLGISDRTVERIRARTRG